MQKLITRGYGTKSKIVTSGIGGFFQRLATFSRRIVGNGIKAVEKAKLYICMIRLNNEKMLSNVISESFSPCENDVNVTATIANCTNQSDKINITIERHN